MLRISLRELFILVAVAAVAIASLKYANDQWLAIVAGVTMVVISIVFIIAIVDRGSRQAFANGFALTMVVYAAAVLTGWSASGFGQTQVKNVEFDHWEGRLATTRLLRYVYSAVDSSGYYDIASGKELAGFDPSDPANRGKIGWGGGGIGGGGGFGGGGIVGGKAPSVSYLQFPPTEKFMPIGHCWWALLFGYVGGHFACYVYGRRMRDEQKLAAETS
jgi:hypothetical protein